MDATDFSGVNDKAVTAYLKRLSRKTTKYTDSWRVISAALELSYWHSYSDTRTYPRPDHPNPRKRKPVEFLLAAVLISLRTTLENEQRVVDAVIERYPSVESLKGARLEDLSELIRPAGMPNQKAERIVLSLRLLDEVEGGLKGLASWGKQDARNYLLTLPGVGPKAADCILSIGLGHASVVVDTNVFRTTTHLFNVTWETEPNFSNPNHVALIKRRLDAVVKEDLLLSQIVHTLFLLEGRQLRGNGYGHCKMGQFCETCSSRTEGVLF